MSHHHGHSFLDLIGEANVQSEEAKHTVIAIISCVFFFFDFRVAQFNRIETLKNILYVEKSNGVGVVARQFQTSNDRGVFSLYNPSDLRR